MKYDIVYSIPAHESPECVYNMYENIVKFNEGISVLVIFHANPSLHLQCESLPKHENMLFHPIPTFKDRFTSKLFLAHMENYRFIHGVDFDFFCTLASNCMFLRPVDYKMLRDTPQLRPTQTGYKMPDPDRWMYKEFIKNEKLNEIFRQVEIEICVITHEGAYFRKEVMGAMSVFCNSWGINEKIFVHDTIPAEEIILPSLEKYLTGKVSKRYCGWIPGITLQQVKEICQTGTCKALAGHYNNIVKIPRIATDEKRLYINSL